MKGSFMTVKTFTLCLTLLMPGALNAMDNAKAPEPLKRAAISIIFKTSASETPITKELTISYPERGKIVSSSESLTQTFSSGAYTAQVEIKEATDVELTGRQYTRDWKLYDSLKVSSQILLNGEFKGGSASEKGITVLVNGKECSLGTTGNYPAHGPPELVKLVIIAKALED